MTRFILPYCLAIIICLPVWASPAIVTGYNCMSGGFYLPDDFRGPAPSDLSATGPDGEPLEPKILVRKILYAYHGGEFAALEKLMQAFKARPTNIMTKTSYGVVVPLISAADILHDRDALVAIRHFLRSHSPWLADVQNGRAFIGSVYSGRVILPYLDARIAFMEGRTLDGVVAVRQIAQVGALIAHILPFVSEEALDEANRHSKGHIEAGHFEDSGKISFMLAVLGATRDRVELRDPLSNLLVSVVMRQQEAATYPRPDCSARLLRLFQAISDRMPDLDQAWRGDRRAQYFSAYYQPLDLLRDAIIDLNNNPPPTD